MLLNVENLQAGYGKKKVLHDLSIHINEGEIVSLIGHNGAGKSTALKAIFGLITPFDGQVYFEGKNVTNEKPIKKLAKGIFHIPQEKFIFSDLSVKDNLELSYFTVDDKSDFQSRLEYLFDLFKILGERRNQLAGTLSGGERRMLGIAMSLIRRPKLLFLDEPSSGLSPIAFQSVVQIIQKINREQKAAVLLVEQNVRAAFKLSNRVYVMKTGKIIFEETGEKLLQRSEWWDLF
jgi:branched-chain amino acid transport system ATP-binding protein